MKITKFSTIVILMLATSLLCLWQADSGQASSSPLIEPQIYVNPSAKDHPVIKVAILPFFPSKPELEQLLMAELKKTGKYALLPEKQVKDWLAQEEIENEQLTRYPLAMKIAKPLEADGVIMGAVSYQAGIETSFSTRLIRTSDGKVIWSLSASNQAQGTVAELAQATVKALSERWLAADDRLAAGIVLPPLKAVESLHRVSLSWQASPSEGLKKYILLKSTISEGPFEEVKTFGANEAEFRYVDSKLSEGTVYYYQYKILTKTGFVSLPSPTLKASLNPTPRTPAKLEAVSGLPKEIMLTWKVNPEPELEGYKLYRALTVDGSYELVKEITSRGQEEYRDENLTNGVKYYYKLSAYYDDEHESPATEPVAATTKPAPAVPQGMKAVSGQVKQITLSWQANSEADLKAYKIWRSQQPDSDFQNITSLEDRKTTYIDKDLGDGAIYYYKLQAIDRDDLISPFTPQVKANTKPLPTVPKGLTVTGEAGKIHLTWQANPENDIAGYNVYRKMWIGSRQLGTVKATSYVDENLTAGESYEYQITALDKDGLESNRTAPVSATVK